MKKVLLMFFWVIFAQFAYSQTPFKFPDDIKNKYSEAVRLENAINNNQYFRFKEMKVKHDASPVDGLIDRQFYFEVNEKILATITFCSKQSKATRFGKIFHKKEEGAHLEWKAKRGVVIAVSGKIAKGYIGETFLVLVNYK